MYVWMDGWMESISSMGATDEGGMEVWMMYISYLDVICGTYHSE